MGRVAATIITGQCTNKLGSTKLNVAMSKRNGDVTLTDFGIHVDGVTDTTKSKLSSSTAGSKAGGFLGFWSTREITIPNGRELVVQYSVKTSLDTFAKTIDLCLIADDTAAWLDFAFPIITDRHSSISMAHISGRFRIPKFDDLDEIHQQEGPQRSLILDKVMSFYESMGEARMDDHIDNVVEAVTKTESWTAMFALTLEGTQVEILVRRQLPAVRKKKLENKKGKVIAATGGRKVTVARRGRKINI